MDWSTIIGQAIITVGGVAVAWIGLRGKLAEISKTGKEGRTAATAAAAAAQKTESSINNRPKPASDRWDAMHKDVRTIAAAQKEMGRDVRGLQDTAQQTRRTLGQLRGEDRIARQETEQLRQDLTDHVQTTAPMLPMLRALHNKWADEPENPS